MIEARTSENSITSNASSIQPSDAARNARCARSSAERHQSKSIGFSNRFHRDPGSFEPCPDGGGKTIGTRRVAVHADGIGVDWLDGSVERHDGPIADQPDG